MNDGLEQELDRMETAAMKAARWAVRHLKPDGAPPSLTPVIESVYKGAWSLTITGQTASAQRLVGWLKQHLTSDGDIPAPRDEEAFFTGHYLYANGYAAIGTRVLGRFDMAAPLMDFIESRQHIETGGFYSHGPGVDTGVVRLDTVSTSIAAWAALFAGRHETAERAGGFLQAVFERQASPDRVFLPTMSPSGNLLSDGLSGDTHAVIDVRDPEQDWYFIGLPAVVLADLYVATSNQHWLELACAYLDYLDNTCDPGAFTDFSSGKSGLAAAHLYRLTGRERYREIALQVAKFVLSKQAPWGFFCEDIDAYGAPPTEIVWSDLDMTLEYILWMKLMAMFLAE